MAETKDAVDISVHMTGAVAEAWKRYVASLPEPRPTNSAAGAHLIGEALGVTKTKPRSRRKVG
jgi:hypothetical protein